MLGSATGSVQISRYFTVVSALPSTVFVSYVYLLVASGAWSGSVDFGSAVTRLDLETGAVLAILSFTAAVALHPLQFSLIQVLEGYWGQSALAQRLAFMRTSHHRMRALELDRLEVLEADPASPGCR